MNEKRATLEVIAPSIEEAIQKGLNDLGLPEQAVEIEVLDEGSRGLFGFGSRQARVRLAVKSIPSEAISANATGTPTGQAMTFTEEPEETEVELPEVQPLSPSPEVTTLGEDFELEVSRDTVKELLVRMKVRARVTAHYGVADDEKSRVPIMVEVRGDDLSILIGRHAETLNALQYITNLIAGKELGHPVSIVVDVEGYRARRDGQIRQLARRMAEQAIKTGRRQVLEPMPANERRIIHIELRDHPQVRTESIGEEPRRKVTIIPKE